MRAGCAVIALLGALASVGAAPLLPQDRPLGGQAEAPQAQVEGLRSRSIDSVIDQAASHPEQALEKREFTFTQGRILAATAILGVETFGVSFGINRLIMNYFHPKSPPPTTPTSHTRGEPTTTMALQKRADIGWWIEHLSHTSRIIGLITLPLLWSNVQLAPDLHDLHQAPKQREIPDEPLTHNLSPENSVLSDEQLQPLVTSLQVRGHGGDVKVLAARELNPLVKADRLFGFTGVLLAVMSLPLNTALYQKAIADYKHKYGLQ